MNTATETHILNRQHQTMKILLEQHYAAQDNHYVGYLVRSGVIPLCEYTPMQKHILFNQLSILIAQGYHTQSEWREHMKPILAELSITQISD